MRRTNPGKVAVYEAALQVIRDNRRDLVRLWSVIVGLVLVVNLPWWSSWFSAFVSGVLLTWLICLSLWFVWYGSGLGPRLEGTWAEGFTSEALRDSTASLKTIPSLRFSGFDIDHAVVARHGIYAVETKMRTVYSVQTLQYDAFRIAQATRTLRLYLTKARSVLPAEDAGSVCPVLVLWGRAGRDVAPMAIDTTLGPVVVLGGPYLAEWLNIQGRQGLGQDLVDDIASELERLADRHEVAHAPESRAIRWLARVK